MLAGEENLATNSIGATFDNVYSNSLINHVLNIGTTA